MNYIKRMQREAKEKDAEIETLRRGYEDLVAYLSSPKFAAEGELQGYVNISDVFTRVRETLGAIEDAKEEAARKFEAKTAAEKKMAKANNW